MSKQTDEIRAAIARTLQSKTKEKVQGLSISQASETQFSGQFQTDSGIYGYTITRNGENFAVRVDPVSNSGD